MKFIETPKEQQMEKAKKLLRKYKHVPLSKIPEVDVVDFEYAWRYLEKEIGHSEILTILREADDEN